MCVNCTDSKSLSGYSQKQDSGVGPGGLYFEHGLLFCTVWVCSQRWLFKVALNGLRRKWSKKYWWSLGTEFNVPFMF